MVLWTFINRKTNSIIRCDILDSDPEFGNMYYFVDYDHSPYWFVESEEKALIAFIEFVHPQYNCYDRPDTEKISLGDYDLIKFKKLK